MRAGSDVGPDEEGWGLGEEGELEASVSTLFAKARALVHDWYSEAQHAIAERLIGAEAEAERVLERARSRARALVDEAANEARRIQSAAPPAGSLVGDARLVERRVEVLHDTIGDVLVGIERTVALAGRHVEAGSSGAAELERAVARLSSAVADMLHSFEELQMVVDTASAATRRPPWEAGF